MRKKQQRVMDTLNHVLLLMRDVDLIDQKGLRNINFIVQQEIKESDKRTQEYIKKKIMDIEENKIDPNMELKI